MKRLVVLAVLGAALATGVLVARVRGMEMTRVQGATFVRLYDHRSGSLDKMLALGDGQAFAAIAQDPTLAHPDVFRHHRDAAYRFGRPLFGDLMWVASAGDGSHVPLAMAVLCVLAAGVATAAVALLLASRGASPWIAALVPFLPGALAATRGLTPEVLALGFGGWAVVVWERAPHAMPAIVALCTAAVLTRETMVMVPVALAVCELRASRRRQAALLACVPVAVLGAWYGVVFLRAGAWPFASSPPGAFSAPFAGLVRAAPRWHDVADVIGLAVCVALALPASRARRRDPLAIVVLGSVVLAIVMGPVVWQRWDDFGRALLPMCAFGLVLLAGIPHRAREHAHAVPTLDAVT